jgi:2-methylcitrate dehydratase PrpD
MKDHQADPAPPEHALAEYALGLAPDDIAPEALRHVAHIVFDTIGVGIGAYVSGHGSGMIAEAHALATDGDGGNASLWSGAGKLSADRAALCNGTWAEVLDYQDVVVHPRNNGHAAVTIVPAALAVAEREGASGRALATAVTAGLEVTIAILKAVGRRHRSEGRGFRTSSIASPVGAAVACGKLIGLDRTQLLNAMGLAGACAPNGLMPSLSPSGGAFGMDKDWVNGLAAQLAVNSADLAKQGMTASDRVVSGEKGIAASHAHGDAAPLEAPSGGAPNIEFVALKKFAACYGVHSAMEAAIQLLDKTGWTADSLDRVVVRIKGDSAVTLSGRAVTNHMAARFSLPYSVASALMRADAPSIRDFEEPSIFDRDVLAMMDRIELVADPELTKFHEKTGGFPAIVELYREGQMAEARIDYPVGSAQRPMSWDDLASKFRELTEGRWNCDTSREIEARAGDFLGQDDVRNLIRLL